MIKSINVNNKFCYKIPKTWGKIMNTIHAIVKYMYIIYYRQMLTVLVLIQNDAHMISNKLRTWNE